MYRTSCLSKWKTCILCRFDLQLLNFTQILSTITYSKRKTIVTGDTAPWNVTLQRICLKARRKERSTIKRERKNVDHSELTCTVREYRFCYVRIRDIELQVVCAGPCNGRSQREVCYVLRCAFCNMRHWLTNISFCNKFYHILPIFCFFFLKTIFMEQNIFC